METAAPKILVDDDGVADGERDGGERFPALNLSRETTAPKAKPSVKIARKISAVTAILRTS